ncbi:hypothetical protein BDB00DRAFT_909806 [Zychaea mexicana]|uniref:uncharacterized protein n=1 Tax=Zychaea mexicana TaxID=64656 RepID=UPI0022FE7D16|nr:uncharacterized protein BDB00DRAFT_909806 [Zychaea mexicana]KAI9492514.1 hypothetical protein BDB00DRAFT_909806 [Zychaea mexicana]
MCSVSSSKTSQTNHLKFHLDTGDAKPILKHPTRFMSHSDLTILRQEIDTMVSNGLLMPAVHVPGKDQRTVGGWAFPALYVNKKNGEKRLCMHFQDLNALTIQDPCPLPAI